MTWSKRREHFRSLLAGPDCLEPATVFDAVSARCAQDLGYETAMLPGSIASHVVLGAPDNITLTLTELAEQVRRICRAAEVPLIVDADHGYGNALSVMRTVQELEAAGASALTIEDTVLPRPFGPSSEQTFLPIEESVGKMKAALAGRTDPALVIAGRTSCAAVTGARDALERVRAYQDAGVDMIVLVGVKSDADLDLIAADVRVPMLLGSGGFARDLPRLAKLGARIALQPQIPYMAAVSATYAAMKALREGRPPSEVKPADAPALLKKVLRNQDYDAWTRAYLGG